MSEPVPINNDAFDSPATDQSHATTVVERYFARHNHSRSIVFDMTFELETSLPPSPVARAWEQTIAQHARLHCVFTDQGWLGNQAIWRRDRWRGGRASANHHFHVLDLCPTMPADAIPLPDVRRGCGALAILSRHKDFPALRFRFHHAACDGVGAARIIGDFFQHLHFPEKHGSTEHRPQQHVSVTIDRIDSKPEPNRENESRSTLPDLRNTWATLRGRNVRLPNAFRRDFDSNEITPSSVNPHRLAVDTIASELSQQQSTALRQTLRRRRIPLNDFAVSALMSALAKVSASMASPTMHVMIMNPVQMRTWRDRRCSSNHIGFAFIRRNHQTVLQNQKFGHHDSILESIHGELDQVRQSGVATELAWGIGAMQCIPGALAVIERIGWFTPTASLTCLSSIRFARRYGFESGANVAGIPVRRVGISAPLQAGGELAATVWDLGNHIGWTLRFAEKKWTDHACSRFLLSHLHEFCETWITASAATAPS